jgi:hypothetical protein
MLVMTAGAGCCRFNELMIIQYVHIIIKLQAASIRATLNYARQKKVRGKSSVSYRIPNVYGRW